MVPLFKEPREMVRAHGGWGGMLERPVGNQRWELRWEGRMLTTVKITIFVLHHFANQEPVNYSI